MLVYDNAADILSTLLDFVPVRMTSQHAFFVKKINTVHPQGFKTMRFYQYFKTTYYIPLIFGYNFLPYPISKSRLIRIIFNIYSLSMSIGFSYLVLSYVKYVDRSPYVFLAIEYVATVNLLLFMRANVRAQFMESIELIDDKLHVDESHYNRLKKVTHFIVLIAIFTRIIYSIALCFSFKTYCNESPVIIFLSGFILIAVDTNQIPRLILFNMVKHRMTLLRKKVENLFQKNTISIISAKDIRKSLAEFQNIYEDILDSIYIISPLVNPFFLLSLVCSFPKIMLLLYNIIVLHQRGVPILHLLVLSVEAIQWALIPCIPGIVFEMTRAQVDEMKLFLLQRHKDCNSDIIRAEIKDFLSYIEQRPCRYCLYRLIPVDATLPVSLFNLCTAYLIVMIQFSHLFDNNAG